MSLGHKGEGVSYVAEPRPIGDAAVDSIRGRRLRGELGTADDVEAAALYLAADESRFVLGAGLTVDGGLSAGKG